MELTELMIWYLQVSLYTVWQILVFATLFYYDMLDETILLNMQDGIFLILLGTMIHFFILLGKMIHFLFY